MDTTPTQWPDATISGEKRELILQLIYANSQNGQELEDLLNELESAHVPDADEIIEKLLGTGYGLGLM